MDIGSNLNIIKNGLPRHVKLVAVSKTKPIETIKLAYDAGQRVFGENKVQELVDKHEKLPNDIEWHMIGHLQTNKAKYIAPFISLIHSVDSLKLLKTIDLEAAKNKRVIDCLLQVHIGQEETKFGLTAGGITTLLKSEDYLKMQNIRIVGLMGMATFTDDEGLIRSEFKTLANIFKDIKQVLFSDKSHFAEISMGMSDDYKIAVEEGSTMVRIGSSIFGSRY